MKAGDGSVYSWGRGMFGRLGLGSEKDELFPVQVKVGNPDGTRDTVKIVGIASGAYHSLALAGCVKLHPFQLAFFYFLPLFLTFCILVSVHM